MGPRNARLLVVGLAPGRLGAHRTGWPFWGDDAGDWLFAALQRHGYAAAPARPGQPPRLRACRISNALRCLPPANRPTAQELRNCRPHLLRDLGELYRGGRRARPVAVLALGRIAHVAVLAALGLPQQTFAFAHGGAHLLLPGLLLVDSFHCSRYNTRTGRLTPQAFEAVFRRLDACLPP